MRTGENPSALTETVYFEKGSIGLSGVRLASSGGAFKETASVRPLEFVNRISVSPVSIDVTSTVAPAIGRSPPCLCTSAISVPCGIKTPHY
ncbi:MAG: hypothetical protein BWY62_01442 [Firmicutes bacterium ADurb.Bin356]|nr:MAG: hypothetical protein BWY62_01442 [Firmicutes bacterium ADurb.Bin356]